MNEHQSLLEALADELAPRLAAKARQAGFKHDASGVPISEGYMHGPGGLLTFPGVNQRVFHTIVGNRGLIGELPTSPSLVTNPTFFVLTGIKDVSGSEPEDVCDDAPVAGLHKGGIVTSVFGRYQRQTPEIDLTRLGARVDRADPLDLQLVGNPINAGGAFAVGPGDPGISGDILLNEVNNKMQALGLALHRLLSEQIWTGNPGNNTGGGGYKEMTGLQQLIITGHVDIETGLTLPSLDSDLQDFGSQRVDANGTHLVNALSYMYRTRKSLAERTGIMPVRWVFVMHPELWWEVTNVWPCSYLTYMCQPTGNAQVQINAADQVKMRDELRNGKYLIINGERINVILDDGIPFYDGNDGVGVVGAAGCMKSDIYMLPMSIGTGEAVTFLEHFDFNNGSIDSALALNANATISRQGPWMMALSQKLWCLKWQALIMPRLICRTPWLAGRLQNIVYCPTENDRQSFPSQPYFVNGGRVSRVNEDASADYEVPWS